MEEGEIEDETPGADEQMPDTPMGMDSILESTSTPEEQPSAKEGSLELKDPPSEGQQQLSSVRRILSPEEIQTIKSIYCSGLPEEMNTKEKIKTYFSEFGEVVRVYMSFKKMACTIHFKDHKAAASAKKYGGVFGTKRFSIFWSQSSISRGSKSPTVSKSPKALVKDEVMTDVVEEPKPKEETKGGTKMTLRSFARRKVSESSPSTSKTEDVKPAKAARVRGKRKEKADIAPSPVDVVFSKNASVLDLEEVLKKPAKTSEEKYRVLEARDKLIRMEREKQQKKLGVSGRLHGTCPDMCPEKERYLRESQRQVHSYELKKTKEYSMNHFVAIKQYSRSSADQEEPLPHELRPSKVLIMTMNYMVCNIMDLSEKKEDNLRDWYFYVWDRTRAIRKDITQQQLCDQDSVHLVEQCARFHIHCAERLVSEDLTVFDEKINNENLTKCLQTLKHLYHDLAMKGEYCPNEAEFRGYIILMNLGDGNFMWEVQELRPEIQQSIPVRFAVQVYFALSSGNYVRFFNLVKSATYLNACLMHRYFNQVRTKALAAIARSFSFPSKIAQFPLSDLVNLLKFESIEQGEMFCEHHGLEIDPTRKFLCLGRTSLPPPSSVFPVTRAVNVIESKRTCSIGEVIAGGKIGDHLYQSHKPHNSFNEAGMLRNEAWNALDQGEGIPVVHTPVVATPSEPEVDREAVLQEVSAPIVEEIVRETVREEVKHVSQDLLDYINKLSMAFLSMYCETFVIDFVRDICSSTLRQMKDEKAKEEREAQKLRKMYEDLISKMSEEAKTTLLKEVVENMCKAEASSVLKEEREKERAVKEIASEMMDEVTASMTETLVNDIIALEREEKKKKLLALTAEVQRVTLKHYFKTYLRAFEKKRQLKISMQGFPAWISSMTLEEQVKEFGSSTRGSEIRPIKRRWSTAFEQNFSVSTQTYPLISVENVIERSLMKSITRCGVFKNELEYLLKWNVAISVPAVWDGSDRNAAAMWVSHCFNSESENGKQIRSICELEKNISDILSLRLRLIKVVGVQPPAANKLCGNVNGIIFIVKGCPSTLPSEATRLGELVKNNNKGHCCPLAILVVGFEKLSFEELMDHLKIDTLVERKLISQFKIFPHHENSQELPHIQMEGALHWLAQTAEFPPPLFVQPLKTVVEQLLLEEFWASLHLEAQNNEMLQLALQDPNDLISLYNASVQLLAEACCSNNYLGLYQNSDSEINRLNEDYLLNFKSVTSLWSKSSYLAEVREVIESLKLPRINSLPAENFMELSIIMQDYCSSVISSERESTRALTIIMNILEKEFDFKSSSRSRRRKSIYSSPWPSVLNVLARIQLECINFSEPTKPDTLRKLIISRELKKMLEALDGSWWMKSSVVPELFEEIQMQITQELTSRHSCSGGSPSEKSPKKDSLWDMKESLEKLTAALSRQSSSFARLSFDIESSVNLGH